MELLNKILPSEIVSKIKFYHSHLVADLFKEHTKSIVDYLNQSGEGDDNDYPIGEDRSFAYHYFFGEDDDISDDLSFETYYYSHMGKMYFDNFTEVLERNNSSNEAYHF